MDFIKMIKALVFIFYLTFGLLPLRCGEISSDAELLKEFRLDTYDIRFLQNETNEHDRSGRYHESSFSIYPHESNIFKETNVQEVLREFEGCRNLFRVNYFIEEDWNIYIEEKGFLYVDERKCKEPITDSGNLDGYKRYELIEKRGIRETWRYRHIKGKWFLYYRQFYQIYLH
ncbi:hypothetical protein [Leptospira santarosai]|uniref:Uncharacterized protein n=1 Tax=Leptospira santarosai serovar Shermani str. LT 821 TaxID=758847 RepID=K8Y3J8_9LEPT|nr:hypothetical protein [Leptospira santarosai]EKT87561.1 hypothetical protein LSS_06884 [Leptospira santarosai serovar Shermani str. LT 821]EMO86633.1 hypothetical protein LEP1GSC070_4066 [Leptospira santarosai str. AIM]EPG84305.1 hypothetical protein LEP1GSC048_0507 [Leptospira santarosai serovar Shermani str. 1342KT]